MKKKRSEAGFSEQRPRRHVLTKQQSSSSGLSWREETELQKALYASLNEKRRTKVIDDDSNDVFKTLSDHYSRGKIHAQRKFALGSNPSSPMPTPIKSRRNITSANAVDVLPVKRPKTEDFLTFLCLRGSPVLPTSMDYQSGNFKDEERASESRSVTPTFWEKSENGSMNGNDNGKSGEGSIQSSDIASVKKSVLQSPNKPNAHKENACVSGQSVKNSQTSFHVGLRSRKFTTRLVQKAKDMNDIKKMTNEAATKNTSGISALRQKYKEKRLENKKIVVKRGRPPKNRVPPAPERRVTRSLDSSRSSGIGKQSRLRQAKLKPSIIEYASSDSENYMYPMSSPEEVHLIQKDSDNTAKLSTRNKSAIGEKSTFKKSTRQHLPEKRTIAKHSSNEKMHKNTSVPERTPNVSPPPKSRKSTSLVKLKKVCSKLPVDEAKPKRNVVPRPARKTLQQRILEVAGSATPSSSSSSSSDSETEVRILRNSKYFAVKKQSTVSVRPNLPNRKTLPKHNDQTKSKNSNEKPDLKSRLNSKSRSDVSLNLRRSKPFPSRNSDMWKTEQPLSNVSKSEKSKQHEALKLKSKSPLKRLESWPSFNRAKKKQSVVRPPISFSSSSSDSEFELEKQLPVKRKPYQNAVPNIIDFSSSDDSLYQELLLITKQGSKELSPKVSSLDVSSSLTNKSSQNSKAVSSKAKRSLSSEAKGSEKGARKTKTDDSPSKKMCDASTNTCDDDILDDLGMFHRSPIWPTFPSPIKSDGGTSPDVKNVKCSQNNYMSLHNMMNSNAKPFPISKDGKGEIVTAPVFHPTVEEFKDPLQYIRKISHHAEQYGICTIVPPATFKPDCKLNDDMRFTSHNQHIHRLYKRWGPNVRQLAGITKHLEGQGVSFEQAPLVSTVELDLFQFYEIVQSLGGLHQVIKSNKWPKVADNLHLPLGVKLDKSNKLYDLYCKYLVSYETLPVEEKEKIAQQVSTASYRKKHANSTYCGKDAIVKGKSMLLSNFHRISRNVMSAWYKSDPSPADAEMDYWHIVEDGKTHVVIHAANVDSSVFKSGFSSNARNSSYAKHPWNLKVLTNSSSSILRCVGPVTGATIPTIHIGMLFTTGCWYQDPHCLPWIEYLHSGAPKIWYGIPSHHNKKFQEAMNSLVPDFCQQQPIWLPSDTAMVPPSVLCDAGVSLSTITQVAGQFVVVFPEAFTATICCGYNISESVYFAYPEWLIIARRAFKDLKDSCEPAAFSFEKLLIGLCNDSRVSLDVLKMVLPMMQEMRDQELNLRKQLRELGLKNTEYDPVSDLKNKKKKVEGDDFEECFICQAICYLSMVVNSVEDSVYCLQDALTQVQKNKKRIKSCKLVYMYDKNDFNSIIEKVESQVGSSKQKQSTSVGAKKSSKK